MQGPWANSNMDGPRDYHTKSVRQKDIYHMISLICKILNVIQMNLPIIQKWTYRSREWSCGGQGGWGRMVGSLGLTDVNYNI